MIGMFRSHYSQLGRKSSEEMVAVPESGEETAERPPELLHLKSSLLGSGGGESGLGLLLIGPAHNTPHAWANGISALACEDF